MPLVSGLVTRRALLCGWLAASVRFLARWSKRIAGRSGVADTDKDVGVIN